MTRDRREAINRSISSKQPSNFTKHLQDIDESDCDDPFFGDDSDEENLQDEDDELDYPLEAEDLQLIEQAAREEAGVLTKKDDIRDRQMVAYNAVYEKLLCDAEFIARNRIAANTRTQYNRANVHFIKWIFYYARDNLLPEYIEMFQLALVNGEDKGLVDIIEKVVMDQEICPLKVETFKAKTFFTYLLSFKTTFDRFFSYSCYDGKRSALMHLINLSGVLWSFKEKKSCQI